MTQHVSRVVIVWLLFVLRCAAQEHRSFSTLQELLSAAKQVNYAFANAAIQEKLAVLTQKTAWGNVLNPRIPASAQTLNNLQQQVIFLPGEVFNQPGTFKQITTGQQYSGVFNIQPQFDILNLASVAQVKSAKINKELTAVQNKIKEQQVYDQINAIYFNILSFQGQVEVIKQNLANADTILQVTQNRFNEEVGRKQDVNEAQVNLINLQDKLEQLVLDIHIQQESLALFFENAVLPILTERVWAFDCLDSTVQTNNTLQVQSAGLQLRLAEQDIRIAKSQNLPMLSFVSSFSWQNLSDQGFFHTHGNWIDYSYVGLKLTMDLPTTVSKLSAIRNKQFQSLLLKNNYAHSILEADTKNRQMVLDYKKAVSQLQNREKIAVLKEDTYLKSLQQYKESVMSLDKLLIAHNDMLLAKMNVITALAAVGFNKSKMDINNKF